MNKTTSPRGITALPVVAIILVLALVVAGAAYLVTRDQDNTNTAVTANTASTNGSNLNATPANGNINADGNLNAPTNTSGFQTYNDPSYDFSISFPATWTYDVKTTGEADEGPYVLWWQPQPAGSAPLPFLSVREDWTAALEAEHITTQDPPYTKVLTTDTADIGGQQVTRLTYKTTIGLTLVKTIATNGTTAYIFNALPDDPDMNAVIASLSFGRSSWQTYTHERGFSIKYPSDWTRVEATGYVTSIHLQPTGASYVVEDSPAYPVSLIIHDDSVADATRDVAPERLTTITIGAYTVTRLTYNPPLIGASYLIALPSGHLSITNGFDEIVAADGGTEQTHVTYFRDVLNGILQSLVITR